jgi:hypothetical protein
MEIFARCKPVYEEFRLVLRYHVGKELRSAGECSVYKETEELGRVRLPLFLLTQRDETIFCGILL